MAPVCDFQITAGWHPFSYVGVDFFGPFVIKNGRKLEKRYGCLFSCLQIRAIHIECTSSMSSDDFILALNRFIARRGCPLEFYSDNGTNLVGSVNELKHAISKLSQDQLAKGLMVRNIKWNFNPPYASHRGGCWERMIRSIRRIIYVMLDTRTPTESVLTTLFIEAERIINNRPILKISADIDSVTLTPNHLLLMRSTDTSVVPSHIDTLYRRQWNQVNQLADQFWRRWMQEYVPLLRRQQKWIKGNFNLSEGDVVIVSQPSTPRNLWPLGVVVEAIHSPDGAVRTVRLKTKYGDIVRDVRKLCLLEAAATSQPLEDDP